MRFVGMMTFIERADRSFLVATPGQHAMHHMTHTPFLMARAGSAIAKAFDMKPVAGRRAGGVRHGADRHAARPISFIAALGNTSLDIVSGTQRGRRRTTRRRWRMMNRIAPGKRVRGNVEKWASSTISLRGGRLENSSAHPDAGQACGRSAATDSG